MRFTVIGPTLVRAVFHLDVPPDGVERARSAARAALAGEVGIDDASEAPDPPHPLP